MFWPMASASTRSLLASMDSKHPSHCLKQPMITDGPLQIVLALDVHSPLSVAWSHRYLDKERNKTVEPFTCNC